MKKYNLSSLYNMRDLGGYLTDDKQLTIHGRIIRSDCPKQFSDEDIYKLGKLNITQIIDLRSDVESNAKVSAFKDLEGVNYHKIPFSMGDIAPKLEEDIPKSYLAMYEDFTIIRKVLELIANNQSGATVFHCAVGKDRTGIISSILLKLCNVSKEDILLNYEKSYENLRVVIEKMHRENPTLPKWLGQSKAEYLDKALELLEEKYGNFENYIKKVGIIENDIKLIRDKLVKK